MNKLWCVEFKPHRNTVEFFRYNARTKIKTVKTYQLNSKRREFFTELLDNYDYEWVTYRNYQGKFYYFTIL